MTSTRQLGTSAASSLAFSLAATPANAGDVTGVVIDETDTVALPSSVIRIPELGH